MAISNKAKNLTVNYLTQQIADNNEKLTKKEKMRRSGYSDSTIESKSGLIESTIFYNEIANNILNKVGNGVQICADSIERSIVEGELENFPLNQKISMLKTLTQIASILAPTVKKKEEFKDSEGNKIAVWKTINS